MEWTFSWNWVSIVALAVPRSVCLLVGVADIPEPFLLKLPSAVPLDLLIFRVVVHIFDFSLRGCRPRSGCFSRYGIFLRQSSVVGFDRKRSLSFPCPGRLRFQESFGRELFLIS